MAILTFQTLDSVMQAPKTQEQDGSGGCSPGGWADPYRDEVMARVGREATAEPCDLLLGKATYETSRGADDAGADVEDRLAAAKQYVVAPSPEPLACGALQTFRRPDER